VQRGQLRVAEEASPHTSQLSGRNNLLPSSDLTAPDAPSTKSLEEISTILRKHYEPKRAIIAERFHFHKREQAAGESIVEFEAALRKLAMHCAFGKYLEQALRDCL